MSVVVALLVEIMCTPLLNLPDTRSSTGTVLPSGRTRWSWPGTSVEARLSFLPGNRNSWLRVEMTDSGESGSPKRTWIMELLESPPVPELKRIGICCQVFRSASMAT